MAEQDFLGLTNQGGGAKAGQDEGGLVFNLNDVQEDSGFELLPKGNYNCIVDSLEFTESSSGNPMIAAQFKVVDGEYEGRVLFDYWVLGGKGAEFGLGKLKKFLTRVTPEVDLSAFNPQKFCEEGTAIGRELVVAVRIQTQKKGEYKGEKRNQVADILAPSTGSFI